MKKFNRFVKYRFWDKLNEQYINKCLRSTNGPEDLKTLRGLVEQLDNIYSICEPDYVDQLIKFDHQMKENFTYNKRLKSKKQHGLLSFFRLFAGQVVLSCKRSLVTKLLIAEEENKELASSLKLIDEKVKKIETLKEEKLQSYKASTVVKRPKILNLFWAIKLKPKPIREIENLVINDVFKSSSDMRMSVGITCDSERAMKNFRKAQQACKLIDKYARSALYAVVRLAWKGYMAKNSDKNIDAKLTNSKVLQKWLKVVQYCQGLLILEAHLDTEQEVPEMESVVREDEQMMTLHVTKTDTNQCTGEPSDEEKPHCEQQWHRYRQIRDRFEEFDENLNCYTFKKEGFIARLARRFGKDEATLSKSLKLQTLDESFKRSIEEDFGTDERDIQFASHVVGNTNPHHYYFMLFGHYLPTWEAVLIMVGCLAVVAILLFID